MSNNLGFKNVREPIIYVLDQELRKKSLKNRIQIDSDTGWDGELVEYPVQIIRENNKVVKCIYGVGTEQWSEEIVRDTINNKVTQVKVTYPDSSIDLVNIHRTGNLVDFVSKVPGGGV